MAAPGSQLSSLFKPLTVAGTCLLAMVLDILPNEVDRAKDLAVWHQALVLPQLIATPIGAYSLGVLGCIFV